MDIKRFTIGSDDDDFTAETLAACPVIPVITNNALADIQAYEVSRDKTETPTHTTDYLEEFRDDEYWAVAYDAGYKTYMSMSNTTYESNEIVYMVKE